MRKKYSCEVKSKKYNNNNIKNKNEGIEIDVGCRREKAHVAFYKIASRVTF